MRDLTVNPNTFMHVVTEIIDVGYNKLIFIALT